MSSESEDPKDSESGTAVTAVESKTSTSPFFAPWHANPVPGTAAPKANLWERFAQQLSGQPVDQKPPPKPRSGANVELDDLKVWKLPPPMNTEGWVGQPDSTKYAPGTNVLDPEELQEELRKGNVVPFSEWIKKLDSPDEYERKLVLDALLEDEARNRSFVEMDDGSYISVMDLVQYVEHNPELASLAARGAKELGDLAPWQRDPNAKDMVLTKEEFKNLPWGYVARGSIWRRPPTRWLKGLDGVKDFDYAMYVHEDAAEEVLKDKFRGRTARSVITDPGFHAALRANAPDMGMAFMLVAAREVPFPGILERWTSGLDARMQHMDASVSRGVSHNIEPLREAWTPETLTSLTKLLVPDGSAIRKGATLIASTSPEGQVVIQGISPGVVKEQESYMLGVTLNKTLQEMLVDTFLGEDALEPDFKYRAAEGVFPMMHGYRTLNVNDNPNMYLEGRPTSFDPTKVSISQSSFQFAKAGETSTPKVLSGISDRAAFFWLSTAMEDAKTIAAAVPTEGLDPPAALEAQRTMADKVLRARFQELGITSSDLERLGPNLFESSFTLVEQ